MVIRGMNVAPQMISVIGHHWKARLEEFELASLAPWHLVGTWHLTFAKKFEKSAPSYLKPSRCVTSQC
jgi:hypothetical protein